MASTDKFSSSAQAKYVTFWALLDIDVTVLYV